MRRKIGEKYEGETDEERTKNGKRDKNRTKKGPKRDEKRTKKGPKRDQKA